jgi:multiple sugar transport system permease protein
MRLRISRSFKLGMRQKESLAGMLFVSPWIIGFLVFTIGPLVASLLISFSRYEILRPPKFIGLTNYMNMASDPLVWQSLYNTFYVTMIGVPLRIFLALVVALFLSKDMKGMPLYRTAFYIPSITPLVAASVLWRWLLNGRFGLINALLSRLGVIGPSWLNDPNWAKLGIVIMNVWALGANMIIYLAAIKGIPTQLYEAADVDGAGPITKFSRITLPLITPSLFFTFIMNTIDSLKTFEQAYIMTGGGPVNSTLFYVYYLFNNAFRFFKMGYASAMAWILFVIILVLTLLQLWASNRWVYYESAISDRGGLQ